MALERLGERIDIARFRLLDPETLNGCDDNYSVTSPIGRGKRCNTLEIAHLKMLTVRVFKSSTKRMAGRFKGRQGLRANRIGGYEPDGDGRIGCAPFARHCGNRMGCKQRFAATRRNAQTHTRHVPE